MLLQRRIVSKLQKYCRSNGDGVATIVFLEYINETFWPRRLYFFLSPGEFAKEIVYIIDDCKQHKYIDRNERGLFVTTTGRDFITLTGFFEEFIKRRKRFTTLIFSATIFSTITGIIVHFWPLITSKF